MRVDLGADVFARDGSKVGTVERIVLDTQTKQIHKLVVHSGVLSQHDRLVDVDMVTRQDDNGVHIDLPREEFEELPEFVEERFMQVPERDYDEIPFLLPNAMGAGFYLYGAPYAGRGYEGRGDSFFDAAPAVAPIIEDDTNLPETDVLISEGTDVFGADGEKVGTVDQVITDEDGNISGFVVKAGFIFRHDVRVPIDWVEQAGQTEVRLNVKASEAEARAYDVEDSTL